MPNRMIGDLKPQETLHDAPGTVETIEADIQARAMPQEGEDARKEFLRQRCESFEARVGGRLRQAIEQMREARDGPTGRSGVYARYIREEQKYRNEQQAVLDEDGSVLVGDEDSHLKCGTTLGLFCDNVNTTSAWLNQAVLGRGGRPFNLKPMGKKKENDSKTQVTQELVGRLLDQAKLRGMVSAANVDLAQHGTCALRQSWVEETRWIRRDDRKWQERVTRRGPSLEHWPLIDVFVSNPRQPWVEDQDAVVWFSRTTLSQMTVNERVWEADEKFTEGPDGQVVWIPRVARRGRFINLERFRRPDLHNMQTGDFVEQGTSKSTADGTTSETNRLGQVSAETLLDLYEFQGWYPIGQDVREGMLDAEMLAYYGIDLGTADGETMEGEALARLCDSLMWYLTINTDTGIMVEFQPCPYREPRTELISGFFLPQGHEFYGMSSDKLAADVGDTADGVLNDIVAILHNNADPPRGIVASSIKDGLSDPDQAREAANEPGSTFIITNPNLKPEDVVKYFVKPYDESFLSLLDTLREIYDKRTLSSQLAQGGKAQTKSGTLGEAKAQLGGVEQRLTDVAMRLSTMQIVVPIVTNVLKDLDWFFTPDELEEEAKRISGEHGLEWKSVFSTASEEAPGKERRPLYEDFLVEATADAQLQSEVAVQFLLKIAEMAAEVPTMQVEVMLKDAFVLMGMDGEKYFAPKDGPTSPRKEFELLLSGSAPKVDPGEDAMNQHLPAHQQQAMILQQMIQQYQAQGQATTAIEGWIKTLQEHIMDTIDLAQQQMQAMIQAQQQAQAEAEQGGGDEEGGGKDKKGGKEPMKVPKGQDKIRNGIVGSAYQTPPAELSKQ